MYYVDAEIVLLHYLNWESTFMIMIYTNKNFYRLKINKV